MDMDAAVNWIIIMLLVIIVAGIALLISANFRTELVTASGGNETAQAVVAVDNLTTGVVTFTSFGNLWGLIAAVGVLLTLVFSGIVGVMYMRRKGYF